MDSVSFIDLAQRLEQEAAEHSAKSWSLLEQARKLRAQHLQDLESHILDLSRNSR